MFRTVSNGAYAPSATMRVDAAHDQRDVVFARLPGEGYVAVWFDGNHPGTVRAQRFDGNGRRVGAEVEVGQGRGQPSVAATADGGFIVSWKSDSWTGEGIKVRLFDSDANPLGAAATVSTNNAGYLEMPEITALSNGGYAVVWKQQDNVSTPFQMRAQILDGSGAKVGGEIGVAQTLSFYPGVEVVGLAGGGFAAAWSEPESGADYYGGNSNIRAQMFTASGAKAGDPILVNSILPGGQANAQLLALPDGGFVAAWTDDGGRHKRVTTFNGNEGVWLQRFDAQGQKAGAAVRTGESGILPDMPTLALTDTGYFLAWSERYGAQFTHSRLKGQFFTTEGSAQGAAFQLGTDSATAEYESSALLLGNGSIVLGWNDVYGAQSLQSQLLVPVSNGTASPDSFGGSSNRDYHAAGAGNDIVAGGAEADGLAGQEGNDRLTGGAGDDQLYGGAGQDELGGGEGHDLLDGGSGADVMAGGAGDDFYVVDDPGDSVVENGGEGSDTVETSLADYSAPAAVENVIGTLGAGATQTLRGNGLGNFLTGGAADNFFHLGGGGEDFVKGNGGIDTLHIDWSDLAAPIILHLNPPVGDSLSGGASAGPGRSVNFSEVERLVVFGGSASDSLTGGERSDALSGGAGDDMLDGGAGIDTLRGGIGNDVYTVDSADVVEENEGEGTDEVRTTLASASLATFANIENLTGLSAMGQTLTGNGGNNVVTGGGGNDVLRLHDGGDDRVLGGAGDDNIFFIGSLSGADVVDGGDGSDTLVVQGPYGSLTLTANVTQIEHISILAGSNTAFGEPGTNRYDYVLTTHDSNFGAGVQARINGAALLAGEDFTFDGSAETNAHFVVYGGKGKDTLLGGLGNDIFFYAEERFASGDTVNGGAGYDGMFLRGNYTIDFNAPGYTGLFTNIENLTLTSATDERYARGGGTEFDYNLTLSNAIVNAGQTLTISGSLLLASETMILDASQESDGFLRLFGGKANDTLKGGGQNDLLHGNLGADTLAGNGGADTFRFDSTAESNAGSRDHILDFKPGTDKIDLSRIDANAAAAGDQAFSWIGSGAFSGTAGQLRAFQQGGTWLVEGDTNGDSVADLVIALTLQGPASLGAGDFLL
jgi:Ca2+-binding RTX toxin-like protein